jgi:hypothetical protein
MKGVEGDRIGVFRNQEGQALDMLRLSLRRIIHHQLLFQRSNEKDRLARAEEESPGAENVDRARARQCSKRDCIE